ncbi:MAG: tyrosine--tRNA ligase [Chromatiaceae bacterium]
MTAAGDDLPPPNDFLAELRWRGLVAQATDEAALAEALGAGPITLYCGFDPTAASLHVGNLVPLLTLRRFQLAGHRPIGLVGGATGLIGDPSGRSTERTLQDLDVVATWLANIRAQLGIVLDFDGPSAATVVSNYDWTSQLTAIELLRDIGKHFSVNQMLAKESVSARLADAGISYTEFSYMILQANDYLELYRRHGCTLQIGGSDQWGNITAGLDLIRRVAGHDGPRAHALTVPLVTKADGSKFGKTAGGAVWLDGALTSPYAFYQFWINTDDRDIARFLRLFSLRPPAEIAELEEQSAQRPAARLAQRALAAEMTALLHSEAEAARVEEASRALFGRGDVASLDAATLDAALSEAPHTEVTSPNAGVVELLVASGLCESKGAARRAIGEGGAYLNNERVTDPDRTVTGADALAGGWVLLRRGKRSIAGARFPV